MDLTYYRTRANGGPDSGYLTNFEADFDITNDINNPTNDFAIKMPLPDETEGLYFAENRISTIVDFEGTEYGGIIMGSAIDIQEGIVTYTGRTWRGMLSGYIIEPPAGEDYLIVSGNLVETIRSLPMHPLIDVADAAYSGNTFQFDRYITTFEGITKLIAAADSDLRFAMSFDQTEGEYTGRVTMRLVKVRDLTSLVEVSQDFNDKINLKITRNHDTPRHLICLGKGDLKDREVIHLYADDNWNIQTAAIAGAYPTDTYDFSSSDKLLSDGMKHYKEVIGNHEQIDVSISDLDVRLGDVISARDHLTGETVNAEINRIVYKCTNHGSYQKESYEYKTKVRI